MTADRDSSIVCRGIQTENPEQLVDLLRKPAQQIGPCYRPVLGNDRPETTDEFGDRPPMLNAGEVDPRLTDQRLDEPETVELITSVHPHASERSERLDEAESLVLAQRLRVHVEQLGRGADEIHLRDGKISIRLPILDRAWLPT